MLGRSAPGAVLHVCLLVLRLRSSVSQQTVQKCPQTKADWDRESASLQCQEPNYYHCLRDDTGRFMQLCAQRVWIQKDMCPEFNSRVGRIDVFECPSGQTGCPTTIFWSNAVFLYPKCYRNSTMAPLATPGIHVTMIQVKDAITLQGEFDENSKGTTQSDADGQGMVVIIVIVVVVVVVFVGVVVGVAICRRRRRRSNRRNNQDKKKQDVQGLSGNTEENVMLVDKMQTDKRKQNEAGLRGKTEKYEPMLDNGYARVAEERLTSSTDNEQKLKDLIDECTKKSGVFIFLWLYSETVDKREMQTKAEENLVTPINMQNNFKKWKVNKSETVYVFDDWITSDGNVNTDDERRVLIEVVTAILKRNTKFVFVIPTRICLKNPVLKNINNIKICKRQVQVMK